MVAGWARISSAFQRAGTNYSVSFETAALFSTPPPPPAPPGCSYPIHEKGSSLPELEGVRQKAKVSPSQLPPEEKRKSPDPIAPIAIVARLTCRLERSTPLMSVLWLRQQRWRNFSLGLSLFSLLHRIYNERLSYLSRTCVDLSGSTNLTVQKSLLQIFTHLVKL